MPEPEIVDLDSMIVQQRAIFFQHLTDDQLYTMVTERLFSHQSCSRETWYHIAVHLAQRLKFPSRRVPDVAAQRAYLQEVQHADVARAVAVVDEEVT